MSALLASLASLLAPILLNLVRGLLADQEKVHIVEEVEKVADASVNTAKDKPSVIDILNKGAF